MTKRWVFGVLVPFVLLMALACGKGAPTGTEEVPKAEPPAAAAEPVPAEAPEVEPAAAGPGARPSDSDAGRHEQAVELFQQVAASTKGARSILKTWVYEERSAQILCGPA